MSKKKPETATPPAADSTEKPFRLIVHIGAGKTGTSSIQETLRASAGKLRERGTQYLGLNLEHAERRLYSWQRVAGFPEFHALKRDEASTQLSDALHKAITAAAADGMTQAIWSNESLFNGGRTTIPVLQDLATAGVEIAIIAYVRRHDTWARSSYIQWALKHKTNAGSILSFSEYMARRPARFVKPLTAWVKAFGSNVKLRNLDEVGDVVSDFFVLADLDPEGIEKLRRNETPCDEDLFLRGLFNSLIPDTALPEIFDKTLQVSELSSDVTPTEWLTRLLPTADDLQALIGDAAEDRESLDALLLASGCKPIVTSPLLPKNVSVDPAKLVTAISQIVLKQALRIKALEDAKTEIPKPIMAPAPSVTTLSLHSEPRKAGPAFLISTERSGSTLIQRLLNCHRDLVVWGEHHGMLNGFAQAYHAMSNVNQTSYPQVPDKNMGPSQLLPTLEDPKAPIEWANPWSLEELRQQLRAFIEGYFASRVDSSRAWGFKEILYNNMPVLRMLHELYPTGRFIFIRRDVREVTRSKVSAFIKESRWVAMTGEEKADRVKKLLADVQEHYRVYNVFMERFPGSGMIVDFETLLERPRDVILTMLKHLELDNAGFDWPLADRVMSSVITKTERDDSVVSLIREVAETMSDVRQPQAKR